MNKSTSSCIHTKIWSPTKSQKGDGEDNPKIMLEGGFSLNLRRDAVCKLNTRSAVILLVLCQGSQYQPPQ